jgi:hypothetical protein
LWPQIDLRGAYWNSLPALLLGSSHHAVLNGYNAGFTVSESLDPRLRVFAGYEYSAMRFNIDGVHQLLSLSATDFLSSLLPDAIHVGKTEHYILIGSELLRTPVKRLAAHIGYGVTSNRFVLRLTWESKWFNTGLAFYPDGVIPVSALMNFQVRL